MFQKLGRNISVYGLLILLSVGFVDCGPEKIFKKSSISNRAGTQSAGVQFTPDSITVPSPQELDNGQSKNVVINKSPSESTSEETDSAIGKETLMLSNTDLPRVYNRAQLRFEDSSQSNTQNNTQSKTHSQDFLLETDASLSLVFPESVKRKYVDCQPVSKRADVNSKPTATFSLFLLEGASSDQAVWQNEKLIQQTTDRDDIKFVELKAHQTYGIRISSDNPQKCKRAEILFSVLRRSQPEDWKKSKEINHVSISEVSLGLKRDHREDPLESCMSRALHLQWLTETKEKYSVGKMAMSDDQTRLEWTYRVHLKEWKEIKISLEASEKMVWKQLRFEGERVSYFTSHQIKRLAPIMDAKTGAELGVIDLNFCRDYLRTKWDN